MTYQKAVVVSGQGQLSGYDDLSSPDSYGHQIWAEGGREKNEKLLVGGKRGMMGK